MQSSKHYFTFYHKLQFSERAKFNILIFLKKVVCIMTTDKETDESWDLGHIYNMKNQFWAVDWTEKKGFGRL